MNSMLNAALGYRSGAAPTAQQPSTNGTGDAGAHLAAASAAHKKGDHHGAKKHALKAVNMLHRLGQSQAAPAPAPADPSAPPAVAAAP